MAKIKNKVKKVKRKKVVRADVKVKKNVLKTHGKNKEENAPEIIFDSGVGKTDALFVDEPKELPNLDNLDGLVSVDNQPETIKKENPPSPEASARQRKPWWKRIFKQ